MPWAGPTSRFPLIATPRGLEAGGGGAAPRTGNELPRRPPFRQVVLGSPRRRVSSDHARAAVIHLCRSSPSASAASFIAATASRSESYEESMDPNIAADRKRSRTSGAVAIPGSAPYADACLAFWSCSADPPVHSADLWSARD